MGILIDSNALFVAEDPHAQIGLGVSLLQLDNFTQRVTRIFNNYPRGACIKKVIDIK